MTSPQVIWAALILAQFVVLSPLLFHVLTQRHLIMTISPPAQAIIDKLTAATTALATALANAGSNAGAQEAEDLTGISGAADPLVTAINDAAAPVVTPLSVSPTTLSVTVGAAVTASLTASGGTGPYSFAASDSGLSVDASGNVTGTIAAAGASTITVSDSSSPVQEVTVPVTAN